MSLLVKKAAVYFLHTVYILKPGLPLDLYHKVWRYETRKLRFK